MHSIWIAASLLLALGISCIGSRPAHAAKELEKAWIDIDQDGTLDTFLFSHNESNQLTLKIYMGSGKVLPDSSEKPDYSGEGFYGDIWFSLSPSREVNTLLLYTKGVSTHTPYQTTTQIQIKSNKLWINMFGIYWDASTKIGACEAHYTWNKPRVLRHGGIVDKLPDLHLVPLPFEDWKTQVPPAFCQKPE
jgi:hypothetical protein